MTGEGRIARGWRLTRVAWAVLRHDRVALTLAVLQGIGTGLLVAVAAVLSGWVGHPEQESRLLIAAAVSYLPVTFLTTFLGVGLSAAASAAMDGGHLDFGQALGVAARRSGQILVWSVLATGVGLLIEELAARLPFAGRLVTWLAGSAWSIGTLFVIPVIALEDRDAVRSIRRSTQLVRERWGEGIVGTLVIGSWTIVAVIPMVVIVVVATRARSAAGPWIAALIGFVLITTVAGAASRVFAVALYRYAVDDGASGPFTEADLREPFRRRRSRRSRR